MIEGLRRYCEAALAEHGCPSASVAVASRGEVVFAEAYGDAGVTTAYSLASVTKPMTATAVCVAADEGLLDLDAPVPGDFGPWPAPTPRQLLQHRGGFAAFYDFRYGDGGRRIDADRYAVVLRRPGSGFEYANTGYRLLGRTLESATGKGLAEFVRERVLAPLGLADSHLGPAYPGTAPAAERYTADGRAYPRRVDTSHPGASAGWAPAGELALFAQTHDRLLQPETAAAMRDAQPVTPALGYGLGWCVARGDGPLVLSHGGGMGGVAAMLVSLPERRLSVAVLTNSTDKTARDVIVRRVMTGLLPGWAGEWIDPMPPAPARPATLPAGSVWAGGIRTPDGEVPVELRVGSAGRAELHLVGEAASASTAAAAEWDLRASFPLQLPTDDARAGSPLLALDLRRAAAEGPPGGLTGVARAYKAGDTEGLLGNMLPHLCTLRPR